MQTYLVELTLVWAACWGLYALLFRKEKFFQLNRFYLLISYAAGLVLPLIKWPAATPTPTPEWLAEPVIWLQTIPITATGDGAAVTSGWLPENWLYTAYAVGCLLMLGRFLYQLKQLIHWINAGETHWKNGICYVNHPAIKAPSSWGKFLFWNPSNTLTSEETAAILAHERAHIQQGHSWDLLLLEITGIFLWWHPFWYVYRRSLVVTHEFLADEAALKLLPKRSYGQLLLQQQLRGFSHAFAHTFNHHQLKNRISMITRQPSKSTQLIKYLLILPMMLVLVYACSEAERQVDEATETMDTQAAFYERVDTVMTFDPATSTEAMEIVKTTIYEEAELMPIFGSCGDVEGQERTDCSNQNLLTHIYTNITYPKVAFENEQEGMAVVQLVVYKDGTVGDVQLLQDKSTEHEALNTEAMRVIRELPDFQPGSQAGEPVNVQMVLPIKFKLEG